MDYEYQHILSENPRLMARGYNSIGDCAKRLDMINLHLSTAIERALAVAQHYTVKNKKDYIMSCFQHESVGFVKSMNEVLLRLSNLMPDHNIMWSFRLDASLARCPHRTFSSHLLFFLEGLVFRWAPYCSSAHISLTFESRGKIQYSAPKIHHKHATRVLQITNRCMLRQAVYANPHEMYHHLSSTFDNGDESDDDDDNASTHSAGSSSIYSDKRLNLNLSVNTKPAKCKGEIEHGYLKIIFQPMDITYASKGSPRSRLGNSPMGGKSRKTTNKLPTPQNSPIAKSRKTMESPSKVENEPSPPSKPTALEEFDQQMEQKHRNPNLQEIERAISSLREEETNYLMSTHALSPYTTTRELMHVMDDFLRAIDPNAHASLASAEYFPLLPEPGNIAFMITLPCYFTLPHDQEKPVRYTPASRPNVSKSLSSSFDAAQTPTYDNTTGVSPLLSRTRTSSSDGDSETPVAGYRPHKVFHSRGRMVSSRIFSLKETEEDETESSQVIINSTYGHQSQPILPQRAETEIPSQKSVTKSASLGAKLKLGSEKESKGISNKSSKPRPSEIAATYPSAATTPTSTYYSTPSTPIGTIGSAVNRFISTVVSSVNMFLNVTPRNTVAPEPLGRAFRSNTVSSDTPPSSEQATPDGRAHPIDTPAFVF